MRFFAEFLEFWDYFGFLGFPLDLGISLGLVGFLGSVLDFWDFFGISGFYFGILWISRIFWDFLEFFGFFWIFWTLKDFRDFLDFFLDFSEKFTGFFRVIYPSLLSTPIPTTNSYHHLKSEWLFFHSSYFFLSTTKSSQKQGRFLLEAVKPLSKWHLMKRLVNVQSTARAFLL